MTVLGSQSDLRAKLSILNLLRN